MKRKIETAKKDFRWMLSNVTVERDLKQTLIEMGSEIIKTLNELGTHIANPEIEISEVKEIMKLSKLSKKELIKLNNTEERTYQGKELKRSELIFQIVFKMDAPSA